MAKIRRRIIDVTLDEKSKKSEQETIDAVRYVEDKLGIQGRARITQVIRDIESKEYYYYTKETKEEAEVKIATPKDSTRDKYIHSTPNDTKKDNLLTIAHEGSKYGTKDDK